MFNPTDRPRVFAIPVGCDFSKTFVRGLQARLTSTAPEELARVEVFVNTQRMARRLKELLSGNGALLLPKIRVITDIANHPDLPITLPEPVSKLRRQLTLAQLVGRLLDADGSVAPQSAKFDLAQSLAGVLDEMQGESIAVSKLADIKVEDQSGHWQRSLDFMNILAQHWTLDHPTDPQDRQRAAALAFAAKWAVEPPTHPVIVIGSTGSRGETALFMRAVAALPQGAVVLPGLDRALSQDNWDVLTADKVAVDNPQSALAVFCKGAGVALADVADWGADAPANPARNALVSLALRPAPFTDQWLDDGPHLVGHLEAAINGVSLIEADTPQEEALTLALRLRAAAQQDQSAVLITPDRTLTRRVTATLERWGILPDDSAGRPLHLTPPGVFLRMIAACMGDRLTPLDLIALLKHPLADSGAEDGSSRRFAREYEKSKLRGGAPFVDFQAIKDWADKHDKDPARRVWADWVERCFAPLEHVSKDGLEPFLNVHLVAAEALAAGPSVAERHGLWDKETGVKAREVFENLNRDADAASVLSVPDYQALFRTVIGAETVREARAAHPKIAIWGTLEARVESADVVILGGLNDTNWPGVESPDPWLNRAMRSQVGLPPPERLIGLSAHDFQQGCGAAELVLSRSVRDGDAPTVASRWMVRILNLMNGLGDTGKSAVKTISERGQHWVDLARLMDRPLAMVDAAVRPAPMPPANARLDRLSVTQVERLIRDPYAIYAAKILELRRLDSLGREPDAMIRGIALHSVVERFVKTWPDTLPDDARDALLRVAEEVLAEEVPWPAVQRIWLARLARIAGWFVEGEATRRSRGTVLQQEVEGRRDIPELGFTLTAKADRIDQDADGGLIVYDYKSGSPPKPDEIKYFKRQLQLEAAIAAVGGFDDVPAGTPSALEYIGLSGAAMASVGAVQDEPTSLADAQAVWTELTELMTAYADPTKGFPARPRMQKMGFAYEFDHLARKGEWEESDAPTDVPVGGDA
jgi:double-strand break repair protein AddB